MQLCDRAALHCEAKGNTGLLLCTNEKKQKSGDAQVPTVWRLCLALSRNTQKSGLAAMGMGGATAGSGR